MTSAMLASVGFIGLGDQGLPMAIAIAQAGYPCMPGRGARAPSTRSRKSTTSATTTSGNSPRLATSSACSRRPCCTAVRCSDPGALGPSWTSAHTHGELHRLASCTVVPLVRDEKARTVGPGVHYLRAAAHPIGHRASVNAMPVGEFQKLLAIELIGHNPQRLVSLLRKTQVTQGINQPLSAVPHRHYHTRLQT